MTGEAEIDEADAGEEVRERVVAPARLEPNPAPGTLPGLRSHAHPIRSDRAEPPPRAPATAVADPRFPPPSARPSAHLPSSPSALGFEEVVATFQTPLLRHAIRVLRDPEAAQDVVQEAFIRYLRKPPEETDPRRVATWLHRVVHNLCIDWIRKEIRMRTELESMPPPEHEPPPSRALEAEQLRERVAGLLDRLTDHQRVALHLKVYEGRSYREIGEITGQSVSAVGYHIYAGLKRLGSMLRQEAL